MHPLVLKALPYVGAVALVGAAVWYIDHRGYERAESAAELAEAKRKVDLAAVAILIEQRARQQEQVMQSIIAQSDSNVSDLLREIEVQKTTIVQPTLVKEIASDPRFTDPAVGITDGMLRAINTARAASSRPCPAGSNAAACFTLPEPTAAVR